MFLKSVARKLWWQLTTLVHYVVSPANHTEYLVDFNLLQIGAMESEIQQCGHSGA